MSALHTQIGISSDCLVVLSFMTLLVWAAPVGAETQAGSRKTITDVSCNNNRGTFDSV